MATTDTLRRCVQLGGLALLLGLWAPPALSQPAPPAPPAPPSVAPAPGAPGPGKPAAHPPGAPAGVAKPNLRRRPSGAPLTPQQQKARWQRLRNWVKSWKGHRKRHRTMRLRRLRRRLHQALEGGPITDEVRGALTEHARRIARLNRLKELAIAKEDDKAFEQVGELIRREHARQQRWFRSLKGDQR